jgi:hypothetical protein
MANSTTRLRRRREKLRAVAAVGLVLGTGATLVVASWTNSVFAESTFETGVFGIQGNVGNPSTPGDWAEYDDAGSAGVFAFGVAVTGMRPGGSAYAAVALRTIPFSAAANVTLQGADFTGDSVLYNALTYRVIESATCNAGAFGPSSTYVVGSNSSTSGLGTGSAANAIALAAGTSSPGTAKSFCFELALPTTHWTTSGLPGSSTTLQWEFSATS